MRKRSDAVARHEATAAKQQAKSTQAKSTAKVQAAKRPARQLEKDNRKPSRLLDEDNCTLPILIMIGFAIFIIWLECTGRGGDVF